MPFGIDRRQPFLHRCGIVKGVFGFAQSNPERALQLNRMCGHDRHLRGACRVSPGSTSGWIPGRASLPMDGGELPRSATIVDMLTTQQRYLGLAPPLATQAAEVERGLREGRLEAAERDLNALALGASSHPEVLRLRGVIEHMRGRHERALESLVASVRLRPQDPLTFSYMGACYESLGDSDNTLKAFRAACEQGPDCAEHWFNFGRVLNAYGWNEHALAVLRQALQIAPGDHRARAMLASVLNSEGRSEDAVGEYRRILADNPASGLSWWGLALTKPMPLDGEDVERMRRALARTDTSDYDRALVHFALGHALESLGEHAAALESLQRAHAMATRGHEMWDVAASRERTRRSLEAFAEIAAPKPGDLGREVIFIVSLPRSGSTLTEQILASHSQVSGTLELPDLPEVLTEASTQHQAEFPDWVDAMSAADWQGLGQRYLQRTQRWRRERPRMTDKLPGNWRQIGAILSMLPNARVVVVRRDPLETCLACYRMLLDHHEYTHDFVTLAEFWHDFDQATAEWRRRCPDRVRVQSYEELTREPEAQIRELLAFCDLPFEPACLEFHANLRRVSTPSASQVREPMRGDTARAAGYGALLDPLRMALRLPAFADKG
jgi:tetratricopeptide (TPR) repeat protein